jgi:hypothetical protein
VVFYGRAQNEWVEPTRFDLDDLADPEARRRKARAICEAGYQTSICEFDVRAGRSVGSCDGPRMHWVHHQRQRGSYPYNRVATGSPFWRVVGRVTRHLYPEAAEENWASWVGWSNLYKVAPNRGGNPGFSLKSRQFEACAELLVAELEMWRPKAAVYLTEANRRSSEFTEINDGWLKGFMPRLKIDRTCPLPTGSTESR